MTGINEWVKVTALDFQGKFVLCSKLGKWIVLVPKPTLLKFSLNQFSRFF